MKSTYCIHTILGLVIAISLLACRPKEKVPRSSFDNCPYGTPSAIFSGTLPGVTLYDFHVGGSASYETMSYDGRDLELVQSGCESRRQEFRWSVPAQNDTPDGPATVHRIIAELERLRQKDMKLATGLGAWTDVLSLQADSFQPALPVELAPGFYATVQHHQQNEFDILTLVLSDRP